MSKQRKQWPLILEALGYYPERHTYTTKKQKRRKGCKRKARGYVIGGVNDPSCKSQHCNGIKTPLITRTGAKPSQSLTTSEITRVNAGSRMIDTDSPLNHPEGAT